MFHLYNILASAVRNVVGEQMLSFTCFATTVHLDIASCGRFAEIGEFGEIFTPYHQQI